jgi:NAD+ synthetase
MNDNFCDQYPVIIRNLVRAGVRYMNDHPALESMVVGLSGGVDSAVTAALARRVADETGKKLYGYIMPCITNDQEETLRGILVGSHLCDEHHVYDIGSTYVDTLMHLDMELYKAECAKDLTFEQKVRAGNIKARIRMINLYNQAAKHKGMVLSTDNFTELLLGFWTLHGDVGDFGFLQELWKTEVYGMAMALGGDCADAAYVKPTDGLGVSNSDLDQLLPGWEGDYRDGYKMVDEILLDYLKHGGVGGTFDADHPVIVRHLNTEFKRVNPVNIGRELALSGTGPKPKFVNLI